MERRKKMGFTLTEIIVVLIIVSFAASYAMPRFLTTVESFRAEEGEQILISLLGAQKRFSLTNSGNYTSTLTDLDVELRPSANFINAAAAASNPIVTVSRDDGGGGSLYDLSISDDGTITCSNGVGAICTKLGY